MEQPGRAGPESRTAARRRPTVQTPAPIEVGVAKIFEIAMPFADLGIEVHQPFQFFVDLLAGQQSRDRAPLEGSIRLTGPPSILSGSCGTYNRTVGRGTHRRRACGPPYDVARPEPVFALLNLSTKA